MQLLQFDSNPTTLSTALIGRGHNGVGPVGSTSILNRYKGLAPCPPPREKNKKETKGERHARRHSAFHKKAFTYVCTCSRLQETATTGRDVCSNFIASTPNPFSHSPTPGGASPSPLPGPPPPFDRRRGIRNANTVPSAVPARTRGTRYDGLAASDVTCKDPPRSGVASRANKC